ncbi:hypothetical protein R1flu_014964 [Riccia fluitans]|uniref:Ubiquitin-like protease family profile domain-containing protein n=1 Tax=Riccia fluitans TaxID=41844 RepID=A0ABD1YHZ8_9MARC
MTASRLEIDPPLSTRTGQTSDRGSNHILVDDTTKEVCNTSSKLPSDEIMEQSVSQMTIMLWNIVEHHGRGNQRLTSLEEDLAHAKLEEEKLKATIQALEKEKSEMNARVALMERKDLYDLLEAKMEGFQIANHPGTIGGFENLNLTITKKWVEISTLNLEEFEKCPSDFLEYVAIGTLPNSLAIFEYMRSIFDSYVNPNNDPNVQPLVKGLDVDDFSMDKFFGLQDPTSPDDVQESPDFEEDLRTNERLRLQAEVRNFGAEPQWVTRSIFPTTVPDCAGSSISASHSIRVVPGERGIERSRMASQRRSYEEFHDEDMQGNLPAWIFVPIHGKKHWSLAIIRIHNDVAMLGHLDSFQGIHDPEAIFHVLKILLCLIMSIDPDLVMTGIMNVEQQEDGHSCGKHVLEMLAGAAKKESDGLDRCFREEGLTYISTLDQVRSFDVLFPMYLFGKLPGPPM